MASFTDTDGTIYKDVEFPPSLVRSGVTRAQQRRYLVERGVIVDIELEEAEEPEVIQERVIDNSLIDALAKRVSAIEGRPEPAPVPTQDSIERLAVSVQRAAISKEEIVQVADDAIDKIETTAKDAQNRLGELDSQQAAQLEAIAESLSETRDSVNASLLAAQEDLAGFEAEAEANAIKNAEAKAMTAAREEARRLMPSYAGLSTVICLEDPLDVDPASFDQRWLGRSSRNGDGAIVVKEDGLMIRRKLNDGWSADPVEVNPKVEVVSKKLAIQDASTKVSSVQNITHVEMGTGGSTPLATQLVNGVALNAARQRIGDGAAYGAELERTNQYARACEVLLRVTALDGPNAGKSDYARYDLLVEDNTAASETISAMLGSLGIGISLRLIPAGSGSVPAWAPAGVTASATHTPVIELLVDFNTTGATQLAVEGSINWVMPTDGGEPLKAAW